MNDQSGNENGKGFFKWARRSVVLKTIDNALPMIWFSIISILGEHFGFMDANRRITTWGTIATCVVIGLVFLIRLAWDIDSRFVRIRDEQSIDTFRKIQDNLIAISTKRHDNVEFEFSNFVDDDSRGRPDHEINSILLYLLKCFSQICDIEERDVSADLFYNFPEISEI